MYRASALKKRERLLLEITGLLENMAVQIKYRALPLGDLFETLKGGEFINKVLEDKNPNRREAWNNAINEFSELTDEREILLMVGNSLGKSDIEGQISMLELNKKLLRARHKEASETSLKKGAMYRSVGLLMGLGLAIIVI